MHKTDSDSANILKMLTILLKTYEWVTNKEFDLRSLYCTHLSVFPFLWHTVHKPSLIILLVAPNWSTSGNTFQYGETKPLKWIINPINSKIIDNFKFFDIFSISPQIILSLYYLFWRKEGIYVINRKQYRQERCTLKKETANFIFWRIINQSSKIV